MEQGDTKVDLGAQKIILGSTKKIIQGTGRKWSNFKGSREPQSLVLTPISQDKADEWGKRINFYPFVRLRMNG